MIGVNRCQMLSPDKGTGQGKVNIQSVSYTHLTLPTTPYV